MSHSITDDNMILMDITSASTSSTNVTKVVNQLISIKFPDTIPKSEIVGNKNIDNYQKCLLLFKKYIMDDAYFSINISFQVRNELYKLFGINYNKQIGLPSDDEMLKYIRNNTKNINDLSNVFNIALYEVYDSMKQAKERFLSLNVL